MLLSNTKALPVKNKFHSSQLENKVAKQLNGVHFYGSHTYTNKWKTRFDYRKSLNKKISRNAFIFDWIKTYFLYKKTQNGKKKI